jgi:anti-anti-sigma factor
MSETANLGALALSKSAAGWTVRLAAPADVSLVVPPTFDRELSEKFREHLGPAAQLAIHFDLENLPGLSSRQLGLLIATQKAVRPWSARLALVGVHQTVRRLLELTQTSQFFEFRG